MEQHNVHGTAPFPWNSTMFTEQHNAHGTAQCSWNSTMLMEQHHFHGTAQWYIEESHLCTRSTPRPNSTAAIRYT
ncbi:uncharacterized protein M421DRAFT_187653 [Didymella exigua CBS 183.55]|uniref:Uncharacterized protein n=1 Tax=Didymella exigua CBS 183.55 TaxID=1150837 RepID=A0A6A5RIA0_9PLEO|nr:uncharacterized protein M421DRAFT_187653 [Didymella exigua CBS 183.55]KAF1926970.1 hypothetical protein M421DRAFT_187653 [Didymella exigua CBS 183.55]